ncbi:MAG: TetR/AcrR family transcriptional regulator [Actinomycetota bacterium]
MPTRAEHRRTTLLRLHDAALSSFEADGPGVTIDTIAERAGVSRRTVFRYVDRKEELAFVHPMLWFDVFERGLADAPASPLGERLRFASRAIALHIDADPEPPRRAFLVTLAHPELAVGFHSVFQSWVDRVAAEVEVATDDPFRARIVGAAIMGMVDAVTRAWVAGGPSASFTDLYDEAFAMVAPVIEG